MDATIIGAPSSTKNADKACDQMHQTERPAVVLRDEDAHRCGQPRGWCIAPMLTAANDAWPELLRASSRGDSAYASRRVDQSRRRWPGTSRTSACAGAVSSTKPGARRTATSPGCAPVWEHVFAVVKRLWGLSKVRYRGLAKNATRVRSWSGQSVTLARRSLAWSASAAGARDAFRGRGAHVRAPFDESYPSDPRTSSRRFRRLVQRCLKSPKQRPNQGLLKGRDSAWTLRA